MGKKKDKATHLKKAPKHRDEALSKEEKKLMRRQARERAEAGRAVRKATDRVVRDIARQVASDAASAAVLTARDAARRLSPAYEPPRPVSGRTELGSWDLHMHSTFSDGSCTVDDLIGQAREAGLTRIAITDHDAVSQLSFIRTRARELSFPVLAGTEVSARDPATGRKAHILAFGLEATSAGDGPLEQIIASIRAARTANTLWQAWALKRHGIEFSGHRISLDEVIEVSGQSTAVYKQHIMEALTRKPYTDPDYQFTYRRLFKGESPARREITYPSAVEVVRAIREQGGTPVLAHPGQTKSWALVPELASAGLMGIEAFHPDHGEAEQRLAFEAAERFCLFVTGGSDFHGRYGAAPSVGCCFVCPEEAGSRVEGLFAGEAGLN